MCERTGCGPTRWAGACTRAELCLALAAAVLGAGLAALALLLALHLAACGAPFIGPLKSPINSTRRTTPESRVSTRCTAKGLPESVTGATDVLAPESEYGFVLALVKVQPAGVTFGCVLTMLSAHWTVTAASCIDSIEEVDSLESFVMVEGGGRVVAVRTPPRRGAGVDLALLKAAGALRPRPARLAAALDFHRFAIGERLTLLGFEQFRSVEAGGVRRLRAVGVARLPAAACAGVAAPRRLRRAATPFCTGVLFGHAQPCQHCAGAALVWRGALAGVLSGAGEGEGGGGACEPARAPRLAAAVHSAWLRAATADDDLL